MKKKHRHELAANKINSRHKNTGKQGWRRREEYRMVNVLEKLVSVS